MRQLILTARLDESSPVYLSMDVVVMEDAKVSTFTLQDFTPEVLSAELQTRGFTFNGDAVRTLLCISVVLDLLDQGLYGRVRYSSVG